MCNSWISIFFLFIVIIGFVYTTLYYVEEINKMSKELKTLEGDEDGRQDEGSL